MKDTNPASVYHEDLEFVHSSKALTIAIEDFPNLIRDILIADTKDDYTRLVERLRECTYDTFKRVYIDNDLYRTNDL